MYAAHPDAQLRGARLGPDRIHADALRACTQDDGARAVADALATNGTLCSLLLSSNEIKGAGLEAFASAIARNRTLLELDLSYNSLGHPNAVRLLA